MANTLEIHLKEILQFISCLSHYGFNCFVRKRRFYIRRARFLPSIVIMVVQSMYDM